ncbi:MAG: glycosyltransferase family 4 protein [Desulfosporosinus sp.]|nr:glycosyltransferase family 4 protein [Desulfosporosinus sp.]
MKEVYICHQYLDKSHFEAIYKEAEKHEYKVVDYIVLGKRHIINKFGKEVIYKHRGISAFRDCLSSFAKLFKFKRLKGKILIVGLAPYDFLMNKYEKVFKNNQTLYFTSWQYWDGTQYPQGKLENRARFEEIVSTAFKGIACVSSVTENQVRIFNVNTVIVNHSIDVNSYKKKALPSMSKTRKYIFLGRFEEAKNIEYLLKWLRNNKGADVTFYFAGSGSLQNQIIEGAKVDSRIHFLGMLAKESIKTHLCQYDFLVLPSKEEPFGIVLLEALAAGVPCVVSNAFGPNEIITTGETGFVFDLKESIQGFSDAIYRSLEMSGEEYRMMVERCICESAKYSPEAIFTQWKKLFELCD